MRLLRKPKPRRQPAGFTLVELLVVVGIMIVLTLMTLRMVNVTQDEDRVRAAAADVRSFLEGARDRAIHAKEPRGVRFIMDTNLPNTVSSMLYIGSPGNLGNEPTDGQIFIESIDPTDPTTPPRRIGHSNATVRNQWINLYRRGLIPQTGAVLTIIVNNKPQFYTMNVILDMTGNVQEFRLTKDFVGTVGELMDYSLQLNPTVLPNQEPRTFPRDVYIDLHTPNSRNHVPASWNSGNMDVLFSPHGTVTGLVASAGVINLVVAEGIDIDQDRGPGATTKEGNERIVSIRTQTGGLGVHFVSQTADPFQFAATGEAAQ